MPRNASGVYVQPASDVNPPIAGTVIDPVAFAAALTDIASEITNSLDRLGRAPMQAILPMGTFRISNVGAPVAQTDGARLADLGAYLPSGAIQDFAMNTAPIGWLVCDGTAYSRATYASLFAAIGVVWGVGDGSTTFNVPDFRGTQRRTWDNGKGLDPARVFGSYQADMLAAHTHVQNPHNHAITDPTHAHTYNGFSGAVASAGGAINAGAASTSTGAQSTGITINNATAVNQNAGGVETVGKNYAILTCIRT
jgi:microcystin-dependent protein